MIKVMQCWGHCRCQSLEEEIGRDVDVWSVMAANYLTMNIVEGMWKVLTVSALENGRYVKDWFQVVCTKDNTVSILNNTKEG